MVLFGNCMLFYRKGKKKEEKEKKNLFLISRLNIYVTMHRFLFVSVRNKISLAPLPNF